MLLPVYFAFKNNLECSFIKTPNIQILKTGIHYSPMVSFKLQDQLGIYANKK